MTGFVASLLAGLATFLGALPILYTGRLNERQGDAMLGFAAGVMLAASFFSLIIPGMDQAEAMGASRLEASATVIVAVLLGAFCISKLNGIVPPLETLGLGLRGQSDARLRRVWVFVIAITLHNFPEGMAVGVSFGDGDMGAGTKTAVGIGIQNLPEGLAVAGSLVAVGYSRGVSLLFALASGLVEPVAGLMGAVLVSVATPFLPWSLGFAAGAMIFVVASEIIPDINAKANGNRLAMTALMLGLGAMIFLDTTLG